MMTLDELKQLNGEDAFAPIDLVFAGFLLRRAHSESPELFCAAALASYCVRAGNSCCDLNLYAGKNFPVPADPVSGEGRSCVRLPELEEWLSVLRMLPSTVIEHYPETAHPTAPLVLDHAQRLYLNRYFLYETSLADEIRRRCAAEPIPPDLAPGHLAALSPYFQKAAAERTVDFQQSAVFLACSGNFSIITGGPGTGKTTVAAALLALELERNPELEIALCAPTGKAQARLRESVTQGIAGLACTPEIRERLSAIPCGTIHSLLSPLRGTTQFRHNEKNPLRADLIVVDEASMVSLPLMAKLLRAVRPEAKIVLLGDKDLAQELRREISEIGDLERISSRVAAGRVTPRELVQLKTSLTAVETLKALLESTDVEDLHAIADEIDPATEVRDRLAREIYPDPQNNQIQKGGIIADGVSPELDDLRRIALHGKDVLQQIQQRESEAAGIPLKISYNNVFGYYIEVRNTHRDKVPPTWVRKQTLTNAERYITEELKEYEEKILGAQDRILQLEQQIYDELIRFITQHLRVILHDAAAVARIDCLQSFATMAEECRYVRPELDEGKVIDIREGRHPVIEKLMPVGEEYIPNDVLLNDEDQQIMMITGPNMSGKSALLRQTALIILMAQMGSFVPAKSAHIGIVDKIFTRVGASDNISQGESTFMVEMLESASILNNLSDRSLILLDEIGRGTSTYDGISIAWAMVEYIHNYPTAHAKTLFATHYHELNEMESLFPRVKNYHVSVREVDNTIVFLRKLVRGGTEHSFGIHVARMAGMPASIVKRASEILANLETAYSCDVAEATAEAAATTPPAGGDTRILRRRRQPSARKVAEVAQQGNIQLSMFQLEDPVLIQIRDQIKDLNINSLTPIEALNKLNEIKKISGL